MATIGMREGGIPDDLVFIDNSDPIHPAPRRARAAGASSTS
jgi:hypothetical protein